MDNIINSLDAFFGDYFGINFPDVQITDIVEIIIIAFFIYQLLIWVQNTRTWMLFRGLLVVIAFFISSTVSDEYHLMVGREASQCGIDYGHCRVPARAS